MRARSVPSHFSSSTGIPRVQLARSLGTFVPVFPKARCPFHKSTASRKGSKGRGNPCGCPRLGRHEACPYWCRTYEMDIRGLRLQSSSWCAQLSWAPTPMPLPTPSGSLGFRMGLPTPTLHSPSHPREGFPCSQWRTQTEWFRWRVAERPVPSLGLPRLPPGENQVNLEPHALPSHGVVMGPSGAPRTPYRLDRLTSQARSVRVHFSRRALHASGDSPYHSSAKHHLLEACFFRMTPFRSMLLTLQSGLESLAPRAQRVPAYSQVLRHSSIALSRRTRI